MNKINVLLACFNGMQFLHDQIQSIAEQDNVYVSLFIADDGSTNGSINSIESFKANGAIKQIYFIKTLRKPRHSKSFFKPTCDCNLHPDTTENDLFSFSDQDDVWYCNKLINANSAIEIFEQQLPVLYGRV